MPPSRPDANGGGTHSSPALDPLSATAGAMDEVPAFTAEQVASHNTAGDCWITIDGDVYDVSAFAALHPGGRHVLQAEGGRDASGLFRRFHHPRVLDKYRPRLRIGRLAGYEDPSEAAASLRAAMLPRSFGDLVPYGDPAWYQRFNSPYYSESHRRWRADLRTFLEAVVFPTIPAWRESSSGPDRGVYKAMGRRGLLALMAGPPFPAEYLATDVAEGRVQGPPEGFDYFHELILYDELARQGDGRIVAALTNGPAIASPVIQRFAAPALAREVLPPLLRGETFAALAISEPNAGSDVAGLLCTASAEVVNGSRVYRVNGNKKWITNGTYADHFVTAVVTGTPGQGGLSFLLVDRDTPGLSVRKVAVRDADVSGTAYLDFDECLVPAERLLGEEGDGFRMIMHNFNHERFYLVTSCARLARVCLEESLKYAMERKTFGKALVEHQDVRMKLAGMMRAVEQLQTWLESVVYQMCTMGHEEANLKIGDVMCLLKSQSSRVYELCARETTQIFGGNALYIGGKGSKIEGAVMQVKAYQIPGGAEAIMDDYAARAAVKMARKLAKL